MAMEKNNESIINEALDRAQTNDEVLEMMQEKRMLTQTIRDRQKNWVGHVLRSDSLLRTVWKERMEGKKVIGRPRTKVLDWMIQETDGGT